MAYTPPPPPAVGSTQSGDKYIGVPDDYTTVYGGGRIPIPGDLQMRPDLHPEGTIVLPRYETDGPTTTAAERDIASLPPETLARLQISMAKAGLIGSSTRVTVGLADDSTMSAYRELLGIANRYGVDDVHALQMLESNPSLAAGVTGSGLAKGNAGGKGGKGGSAGGGGPRTTTSTSTQKFTALDAEALANDAYRQALGEDASPKQSKALRAALNAYAKAHPSTSTTTYDARGNATTTSSGGIDSAGVQQIATDMARSAPDYAETQAATTYANALFAALDAPADVDGTA